MSIRTLSQAGFVWLLTCAVCAAVSAQTYTVRGFGKSDSKSKTSVSVELLTGKQGVGLRAQQWSQVFRKLGIAVRIRRPLLDDQPEVKERKIGTLRQVTAIGRLERDGRISFPDRRFSLSDGAKLKEWLKELEAYGAQGAPEGKPLWGLSKSQFGSVYEELSRKQTDKVAGLSLDTALDRFDVSPRHRLRMSTAAKDWVKREFAQAPPVRQNVQGMSKGTGLAVVLSEYGLGLRPLRTPGGSVELTIVPLSQTSEVWPVGWDLKLTRQKTAPKLFEIVPLELNDNRLLDVLDAVTIKTGVSIFVNHYAIAEKGIDVEQLRVSYPFKKTSWSLLLSRITSRHRLTRRLRIDELGRPFIWITPFEPRRATD